MIEKIQGIRILGKCFKNNTEMSIFKPASDRRIAVIYGSNGSGKSTIAHGFRKCVEQKNENENENNNVELKLIDENNHELLANSQPEIHVFDEKYIRKIILLENKQIHGMVLSGPPVNALDGTHEGIGTIVLLDEDGNTQEKIDVLQAKLSQAKKELTEYQSDIDRRNKADCRDGVTFYSKKIREQMMGNGGWRENQELIDGQHKKITQDVFDSVVNCSVQQQAELDVENFSQELELYVKTGNVADKIEIDFDNHILDDNTASEIFKLLEMCVKPQKLNERELKIVNIFSSYQNGSSSGLTIAENMMKDDNVDICPYCLQNLSKEYKKTTIEAIERIIDKDVAQFQRQLDNFHQKHYRIPSLGKCEPFAKQEVENLTIEVNKYNQMIDTINESLTNKRNNPFGNVVIHLKKCKTADEIAKAFRVNEYVDGLNRSLDKLVASINKHNESLEKRKEIAKKLKEQNILLACKRNERDIAEYRRCKAEMIQLEKNIQMCKRKISTYEKELTPLFARLQNIGSAAEHINRALATVFLNKERMQLMPAGDCYEILVKGQHVSPESISVGERNILSLCYFFVQLLNGKKEQDFFKNEMLLVLDDPISSFDKDNRVGMLTLIRSMIESVLSGNSHSKVIMLTHDVDAFYNFMVMGRQIQRNALCMHYLSAGKMEDITKEELDVYSLLLKTVIEYAEQDPDKALEIFMVDHGSHTIGNSMRRLAETFFTFKYREGMDSAMKLPGVVELLGDRKEYFQTCMSRITLNSESHMAYSVRGMVDNPDIFSEITPSEKIKTARIMIALLFILDKVHIETHLHHIYGKGFEENYERTLEDIKKWIDDIPCN